MITQLSKPQLRSEDLQKLAEQFRRLNLLVQVQPEAKPESLLEPNKREEVTTVDRLNAFYRASILHGLAVALWRLPQTGNQSNHPHAIADFSGEAHPIALDFRQFQPGFLISPFISDGDTQARHLAAHAHFDGKRLVLSQEGLDHSRRVQFLDAYQSLLTSGNTYTARWYTPLHSPPVPKVSEETYKQMVGQAVEFIRSRGIRKVVTSRLVESELPPAFDPVLLFRKLCQHYPHAFISLVALPNVGTWIGATPETLVRIDDEEVCTMALAGTQARPANIDLDAVVWGAKEIEEQAVVSADIRDFFRRTGVQTGTSTGSRAGTQRLEERGPHTVVAGNVVHLQTTFRVKVAEAERVQLANQILTELHPTSAVCGMPKERALSFIQEHEQHDRSFYSGFLGPVQINGCSDLFVNLRCMQLGAKRAQLYVGGGITADSNPAAEWRETELKARTLLDVLR